MIQNRRERMLHYLPELLSNLREYKVIVDAEHPELEEVGNHIADILDQQFIETATWGLDIWERISNLPKESSLTLEQRRIRILNHFSSVNTPTLMSVKNLVDSYLTNKTSVVEDGESDYEIIITLLLENINLSMLSRDLQSILPAHLKAVIKGYLEKTDLKIIDEVRVMHTQYYRISEFVLDSELIRARREVRV